MPASNRKPHQPSPHRPSPHRTESPERRARASLRGLSIGDALGSQFFVPANAPHRAARTLPPAPWSWTDDTEMACSVLAVLTRHQGRIDMDELADSFVRHHDLYRGYGAGANTMLRDIREGVPWPKAASALFGGTGSYGNGAAMRAAPIGAWFAGDPDSAARQAARSAVVTHTHPEGITGAVAVAVAASLTADPAQHALGAREFLDQVLERLPNGRVRHGVWAARGMAGVASVPLVVRELGNGRQVCAQDTVPFALWVVARHRHDFAEAVWTAVEAGGDVDTTCAIIGGILAADPEVAAPADWTEAAEALPDWAPRDDEQPSGPNRCGTP